MVSQSSARGEGMTSPPQWVRLTSHKALLSTQLNGRLRLYIEISFSQDGRGRGLQESGGGGSERLNERGREGVGVKRHAVPGLHEDTRSSLGPVPCTSSTSVP